MTAIADSLEALVGILKADATVAALVGTRVYGYELPRARTDAQEQSTTGPLKSIVVAPSGGANSEANLPIERRRVDTYCYGETLYQADRVRRAVYAALKGIDRTTQDSIVVYACTPAGGAITGRDPETDWPVHWNSWQVTADTRTVA